MQAYPWPPTSIEEEGMARLIRMDGTGHSTLAEWTAADDRAFATAVEEFRAQTELGCIGTVPDGPRQGDAGARAAARGRPRDHAPADRRRLAASVAVGQALPELAAVPWRDAHGRALAARAGAASGRPGRCCTRVPFAVAGVGMLWLEPLAAPVALAAFAHAWMIPELYAFRGASVVRPKGPRNEARGAGGAGPARATCSATTSASCSARPGWRSSAASWASGWSARRARCS